MLFRSAVIAKSMARIHKNNLVNHGVVPLIFADPADYTCFDMFDELRIENFHQGLRQRRVLLNNVTKNRQIALSVDLTDREIEIVIDGGQLRHVANKNA